MHTEGNFTLFEHFFDLNLTFHDTSFEHIQKVEDVIKEHLWVGLNLLVFQVDRGWCLIALFKSRILEDHVSHGGRVSGTLGT
jgi:hypothetical protein